MITSLLMMLTSCQRKIEYEEASHIIDRMYGSERFNDGQLKWELMEVLGPNGPYTDVLNDDFRGSGGRLSPGQPGTFSVSNGLGTVTKNYGGVDGPSYMAIPVQNQNLQNAVIVCRTVSTKTSEAQQAAPRNR